MSLQSSVRIELLESRVLLADVPEGFTDTQVVTGLNSPTSMAIAPDGRIFLTEQSGRLRIIKNGSLLSEPFATLPVQAFNDRGLLGVALDPNFASNGYVYVHYTAKDSSPHARISRLRASGDRATGGETVLLDLPNIPSNAVHMGGALHFGGDGKLYVAIGENSSGRRTQDLDNPFGKMLRLNPDGSVPGDNPFLNQTSGVNRYIWARGLRNPFTFAVQPGTGRMLINDVGSDKFEEINEGIAGANYGWNTSEGPTNRSGETGPFYWYDPSQGCSINGSTFYNPPTNQFPSSYVGKYFFADYCGGWIRVLDRQTKQVSSFASGIGSPIDVDVAPDGSMYYLARGADDGRGQNLISRIRYTEQTTTAPQITRQPENQSVARGKSATFSVTATGTAPLSYQWQRNGQNIVGATASTFKIDSTTMDDHDARFGVIVSNSAGNATSEQARLTVIDNTPPVAEILSPAAGTRFFGGQTIEFSGRGTDLEDGTLDANRFTWEVVLHHADHTHPFLLPFGDTTGGSFTIPNAGKTEHDIFYRINLKVTDSAGLSHSMWRDIEPIKSDVTIDSNVPGATIKLDGQTHDAPHTFTGVAGIMRQIDIEPRQLIDGVHWEFSGWSDGGQSAHSIATPMQDGTYTAIFRRASASKGLKAIYFNNRDFTGTQIGRIDGRAHFNWNDGSPDPLIHRNTFAARWTGKVQPLHSETYTFHVRTSGGARLLVNDQLLFNANDAEGGDFTGSIDLQAGRKYNLKLEYNHGFGPSRVSLRWSSESTPLEPIPRSSLYPATSIEQTIEPTAAAFVRGGNAARDNFAGAQQLQLRHADTEGSRREAFLKFDLSEVEVLSTARLRLYGQLNARDELNVQTAVYHAPGAKWSEESITWENRPTRSRGPVGIITVANDSQQWYEFDISRLLRAERASGREIVTLRLANLDPAVALTIFNSSDASENRPQLVITA